MTATVEARLRQLADRYGLPVASVDVLARLLAHLGAAQHAPTTVRGPFEAVDVHVADSLTGLEIPEIRAARRVADIGAGAGYPGLVLAVALPEAQISLVESSSRKAEFISSAAAAAEIANVECVALRAEEWEAGFSLCDVVTARALAPLAVLGEYAAPLLREGGVLIAWKGRRESDEESAGHRAATELGMEPEEPLVVIPFATARDRHLHVWRKVSPTPDRFPRRPGMASKRPLG